MFLSFRLAAVWGSTPPSLLAYASFSGRIPLLLSARGLGPQGPSPGAKGRVRRRAALSTAAIPYIFAKPHGDIPCARGDPLPVPITQRQSTMRQSDDGESYTCTCRGKVRCTASKWSARAGKSRVRRGRRPTHACGAARAIALFQILPPPSFCWPARLLHQAALGPRHRAGSGPAPLPRPQPAQSFRRPI